jgi:hypothetical protein
MFIKKLLIASSLIVLGYIIGNNEKPSNPIIKYREKIVYVNQEKKEQDQAVLNNENQNRNEKDNNNCSNSVVKSTYKRILASNEEPKIKHNLNNYRNQTKKIRAKLLFGQGMNGTYSVQSSDNNIHISSNKGLIVGFGFDYLVFENISVGAQYLSNESAVGSIGYDF